MLNLLISHQWDVDDVACGNGYKRHKSCRERMRGEALEGKK